MAHNISDSDSDATYDPTEAFDGTPSSPLYARIDQVHSDHSNDAFDSSLSEGKNHNRSLTPKRQEHSVSDSDSDGHQSRKKNKTLPNNSNARKNSGVGKTQTSSPDTDGNESRRKKETLPEQFQSDTKPSNSSARKNSGIGKTETSPPKLAKSDTIVLENRVSESKLPMCRYGLKCYRKNPSHFEEFSHPDGHSSNLKRKSSNGTDFDDESSVKSKQRRVEETMSSSIKRKESHTGLTLRLENGAERLLLADPLNFFMIKVHGIADEYNQVNAIGIRDILHGSMGILEKSAQFNYMFDIPWLLDQYPPEFRNKPLLLVHGFQRQEKADIDLEVSSHDHIRLCQARLDMPYGTHHTKMMLLLYDSGMRVVIHTSNLIHNDWHQKSQGAWVSPLFPPLGTKNGASAAAADVLGTDVDSPTHFKRDLLEYLRAYKARALDEWIEIVKQHDMSSASVYIIGSVPGRHMSDKKHSFGHLKLRKVLQENGPSSERVKGWPVIGQFSSIGSLGNQAEVWLCGEWYTSLSAARGGGTALGGNQQRLKLIFPSKDNVRLSLEGYPAGASLPYSIQTAKKQTYLHSFFHQWKSSVRGRDRASPHIKTYTRMSPEGKDLAWFVVTSANLSKAAWGALEKNGSQLMIRSYEIGVLFLPQHFGCQTFKTLGKEASASTKEVVFPQPYDLPPVPYSKSDKPWIWDIPYTDLPDSNGNAWCPR